MKSIITSFRVLMGLCVIANAAHAGQIRIFTSHLLAGVASPPELVPGKPEYQRIGYFVPGETIYIWAQASPGLLFDAIGIDLETMDGALISGPVSVPNPTMIQSPSGPICRWHGFVTGMPVVPPPVSLLTGIKMACVPLPGLSCKYVGVSNPVNPSNMQDGANDPATQSVMIAKFKAAGTPGPGFFSVNTLLIVDYPQTYPDVYFGWGDAPVSGEIAGARSILPDWFVDYDTDNDGVTDMIDNCVTFSNSLQLDSDGDGRGDRCDACDHRMTGDLSNDGLVDINDTEAFAAMLLNPPSQTSDDTCAADADYSGVLDGQDVPAFTVILVTSVANRIAEPVGWPESSVAYRTRTTSSLQTSVSNHYTLGMNLLADRNHDGMVDGRDIAEFLKGHPADSKPSNTEITQFIEALVGQ